MYNMGEDEVEVSPLSVIVEISTEDKIMFR